MEKHLFKDLYSTAVSIIFKPSEAWVKLSGKQTDDNEAFLSNYIYPFAGVIAAAAFTGILFTRREFELQVALKAAIRATLSVTGGFWLASWLLNEAMPRLFNREKNMKLCQRFVGYSSSMMFALTVLLSLLPDFFFLRIFVLYTIYIVWEGAVPYMGTSEKEQLKFVCVATAIIILTPAIIEFFLYMLMPGLRF